MPVSLRKISTGGGGGGGDTYNPVTVFNIVGNGPVLVPAGLVAYIEVENAAGLAGVSAGFAADGTDIIDNEAVAAVIPQAFSVGIKLIAATNIYFSGITSATTIRFYKF